MKSILLIFCLTAAYFLISDEGAQSPDGQSRHPNGDLIVEELDSTLDCSNDDSVVFHYYIAPTFRGEKLDLTIQVGRDGSSRGSVDLIKEYFESNGKAVTTTFVQGLQMDSIPWGALRSVMRLVNQYQPDTSVYLMQDGPNKSVRLCDEASKKLTILELFVFKDTPHSKELNDSLSLLVRQSIPSSQKLGVKMRELAEQ